MKSLKEIYSLLNEGNDNVNNKIIKSINKLFNSIINRYRSNHKNVYNDIMYEITRECYYLNKDEKDILDKALIEKEIKNNLESFVKIVKESVNINTEEMSKNIIKSISDNKIIRSQF